MNTREEAHDRVPSIWRFGILLMSALMVPVTAMAATRTSMPPDYYGAVDPSTLVSGCQGPLFPNGVASPKSSSLPNQYVLLLVFDNPANSGSAGMRMFKVPRDIHKSGCLEDPDHPQHDASGKAITDPHAGWGIRVDGGCPSDCTLNVELYGKLIGVPGCIATSEPDPLGALNAGTPEEQRIHWAIFFAPYGGAHCHTREDARVWQIRVRDAVHAAAFLGALENKYHLSKITGYEGHLLIGHTSYKCAKEPCP